LRPGGTASRFNPREDFNASFRDLVREPVALAACNSQPSVSATNASAKEVQEKVAAATGGGDLMSPGRWEGTMTIKDMKMPNLPPEQQKMLAGRLGGAEPVISCVTPEEVKARRAFFTGDEMKGCTYDHFTMSGGKLDAKVTCDREGTKMTATMNGDYSPGSYHLDMTSNMSGDKESPMSAMSSTIVVDAKRTGECRGDEDTAARAARHHGRP